MWQILAFYVVDASAPLLRELSLPIAEAPTLLALLRELGVSAATIYPGFDGVGRDVAELRLLE